MEDQVTVANFQIWVEEISFSDNHKLNKDTQSIEEEIINPVWIRNQKNDPIAYTRNDQPIMQLKIKSDRTPKHPFNFWIMGRGLDGDDDYTTPVYPAQMQWINSCLVPSVIPIEGQFKDSVDIVDLEYYWWVNKTGVLNPMNFEAGNRSNHKIYVTYDTPLHQSTNILALEYACKYADSKNVPKEIAQSIVSGIYSEGWAYYPIHPIFTDPLEVIDSTLGQCADYANLSTCLYLSLGIQVNSRVIWNSANYQGDPYCAFWLYTETNLESIANILTYELTSCDGTTKYWPFSYHAVSYCSGYLCDAVFNEFRMPTDISNYLRYYIYPDDQPWRHNEPPPELPDYYNWAKYISPSPGEYVLPDTIRLEIFTHQHP